MKHQQLTSWCKHRGLSQLAEPQGHWNWPVTPKATASPHISISGSISQLSRTLRVLQAPALLKLQQPTQGALASAPLNKWFALPRMPSLIWQTPMDASKPSLDATRPGKLSGPVSQVLSLHTVYLCFVVCLPTTDKLLQAGWCPPFVDLGMSWIYNLCHQLLPF